MLCLSGLRARQELKGTVSQDKLCRLPDYMPSKAARACSACLDNVPDRGLKRTVSQDKLRRLPACLPNKAAPACSDCLDYAPDRDLKGMCHKINYVGFQSACQARQRRHALLVWTTCQTGA
jgi:hypothetical protein